MMNEQAIATVKSTVPVLRENGVVLTQHFYKRMLSNNPELKNIFNLSNQSTGRQPRALAAAVLAYAENIEDPSKLLKAVDRMAMKHVTVDIQPAQYAIVGENLLHSISEVLNLPMDHEIIKAWEQAYGQLADILINREKEIYSEIEAKHGGWKGWRNFKVVDKKGDNNKIVLTIAAEDQQAITPATEGEFISIKVGVPGQDLKQPKNFSFDSTQNDVQYQVTVEREEIDADTPSVPNIILDNVQVGDTVEVSAPLRI